MANTQKTFALSLGMVLLLVGIAGFIENSFIGDESYFATNAKHNILHLIAGLFGLYVGTKGAGSGYNATIGWLGVVLGIFGFIPGIKDLLLDLLNINTAVTVFHLALGVIALLVYYTASKQTQK